MVCLYFNQLIKYLLRTSQLRGRFYHANLISEIVEKDLLIRSFFRDFSSKLAVLLFTSTEDADAQLTIENLTDYSFFVYQIWRNPNVFPCCREIDYNSRDT